MKFKLDTAGRNQQQAIRRALSRGLPLAGLLALAPLNVSGGESTDSSTPGKVPLPAKRVALAGDVLPPLPAPVNTDSKSGNESEEIIKVKIPTEMHTAGIMQPPPKRQLLPSETTIYVVKSGDVLCKIAKRYNTTTKTLFELNHLDCESSTHLGIGQKIIVPIISSEKK